MFTKIWTSTCIVSLALLGNSFCFGSEVVEQTQPKEGVELSLEDGNHLSVHLSNQQEDANGKEEGSRPAGNVFSKAINRGGMVAATGVVVSNGRVLLRRLPEGTNSDLATQPTPDATGASAPTEAQQERPHVASR